MQAWRRPLDRRTSTQMTAETAASEVGKAEVDALSASCIEDEEKEEVDALSASCIEDEDDMFAIATQGTGVVNETVDDTVENTLDNTSGGGERKEVQESSSIPDSMDLLEQETAPLKGYEEEEKGMFFHNLAKQEALNSRPTTTRQTTEITPTNDSALLDADTQAVVGQPNESSLLFGEPTQVS